MMKKELEKYCCPYCGSEFIEEFDCSDCEIDLTNSTVYTKQYMTCTDCECDFTLMTYGKITNCQYWTLLN